MAIITNTTSFTKLRSGDWGIKGNHLQAGKTAVVYKRNGERTEVIVDRILWTGQDGTQIASIRSNQAAAPVRRAAKAWSVRRPVVGGHCQSCGCEVWDCDC
mgnify:CR=1 FL=1|jgi:hypothetical protein